MLYPGQFLATADPRYFLEVPRDWLGVWYLCEGVGDLESRVQNDIHDDAMRYSRRLIKAILGVRLRDVAHKYTRMASVTHRMGIRTGMLSVRHSWVLLVCTECGAKGVVIAEEGKPVAESVRHWAGWAYTGPGLGVCNNCRRKAEAAAAPPPPPPPPAKTMTLGELSELAVREGLRRTHDLLVTVRDDLPSLDLVEDPALLELVGQGLPSDLTALIGRVAAVLGQR